MPRSRVWARYKAIHIIGSYATNRAFACKRKRGYPRYRSSDHTHSLVVNYCTLSSAVRRACRRTNNVSLDRYVEHCPECNRIQSKAWIRHRQSAGKVTVISGYQQFEQPTFGVSSLSARWPPFPIARVQPCQRTLVLRG